MAAAVRRKCFEEGAHGQERGEGDLRGADQREAGTALAGGHPFGDDGARPIREQTEERAFTGEGGDVLALYRKRLTRERVPGIVDGDRT
jgi:hypothetical protein